MKSEECNATLSQREFATALIIMFNVIIALGSNSCPAVHVQWASQWLSHTFHDVRLSRTLWTPDIKGTGRYYMNRLAIATTTLSRAAVEQLLKETEGRTGRNPDRVTLDLDLMQYDDTRYHLKDWPRPYIQQLIPDIL